MCSVNKEFFEHLESFYTGGLLLGCFDQQIKTVLPLLTRCCLCNSPDHIQRQSGAQYSANDSTSNFLNTRRQLLMKALLGYNEVNFLTESLSTDFNEVMLDCSNHIALRCDKHFWTAINIVAIFLFEILKLIFQGRLFRQTCQSSRFLTLSLNFGYPPTLPKVIQSGHPDPR